MSPCSLTFSILPTFPLFCFIYLHLDRHGYRFIYRLLCLAAQLCLTLCDPMLCSPIGSSVHGDSPGKNIGVGCCTLLQGNFPIQGLNPGLQHCRWILYPLSHQGDPYYHTTHFPLMLFHIFISRQTWIQILQRHDTVNNLWSNCQSHDSCFSGIILKLKMGRSVHVCTA